MTLGEKQRKFLPMVARLIQFAYERGFQLTVGDAFRDPRVHGKIGEKMGYGHPKSAHKNRLAIDLNLFINGVYQEDGAAHGPLHDFWESIGGSPRIANDMNHYSIEHDGIR